MDNVKDFALYRHKPNVISHELTSGFTLQNVFALSATLRNESVKKCIKMGITVASP